MDEGIISAQDYSQFWSVVVKGVSVIWSILAALSIFIATASLVQLTPSASMSPGVAVLLLLYGLLLGSAGIGLLFQKRWGRLVGKSAAVISLFAIPVGTLFGILVLVGLRKNQAGFGASAI